MGLSDATWPELDADSWADRPCCLRHRMLPGPLARTAHHQQVAMTDLVLDGDAAPARPEQEVAGGAQRDDGDDGVGRLPPADGVAVPGDRVAPIAIQAQPSCRERLAELGFVVGIQGLTGRHQIMVRKWIVLAIEAQQSRYVDNPLVHLSPLGLPRHLLKEIIKEAAGAAQPSGKQVHPGTSAETLPSDHAAQRPQREMLGWYQIKQRGLNNAGHRFILAQIFDYPFEFPTGPPGP
jgi:hypothetical protein